MIVYVISGHDPICEYDWVELKAYSDRLKAEKAARFLEEGSKDEETGYVYYYRVTEVEVI